jgi:hypothetical protein
MKEHLEQVIHICAHTTKCQVQFEAIYYPGAVLPQYPRIINTKLTKIMHSVLPNRE